MRLFHILTAVLLAVAAAGQSVAPPVHIAPVAGQVLVFVNATLHVDAYTTITNGTLVVKDGLVVSAGEKGRHPAGAQVRDLHGLHIWPALIDPYSDLGMPMEDRTQRGTADPPARHWNGALRADAQAHVLYRPMPERAEDLRELGFATVLTHRMDGIARGTSAAVLLNEGPVQERILAADVAAHFSLRKGSSPSAYPTSKMGAVALIRQAFLDARWTEAMPDGHVADPVLVALARQLHGRLVFEAEDRNEVLRWGRIMNEFGLTGMVKGAGDEYARIEEVRALGWPLILPLALPMAYDVEDPYDAMEVPLARLSHWAWAPRNAAVVDSMGIPFAFTTNGRKELKGLWKDLRRMVANGLDSARAIDALTTGPARLFGLDDRIGALRPGMLASFLITSEHLLHPRNAIDETWVRGERFVHRSIPEHRIDGTYDLNLVHAIWILEVTDRRDKLEAFVRRPMDADTARVAAMIDREGDRISLAFAPRSDPDAVVRLSGSIHADGGVWDGQGLRPGGEWFAWSAIRKADSRRTKSQQQDSSATLVVQPGTVRHPMSAFGWSTPPEQATVILRHATIWTNGPEGILRDADVCIHQGRIKAVGKALDASVLFPGKKGPHVVEFDATGRHVTAGMIDEHSHIAIKGGVNEGGAAIVSEVRVGDVIDPDNVNILRSLAGGVTAAQLLHGSADPIGGQSALIKMRWGHSADSLLIRDAPRHIKFALGENVKQSNHTAPSSRFPQSRMGVEQLYYDAFHRARDHGAEWRAWNDARPKQRPSLPPRRDLRLEALDEILRGERNITCHSYVQSEVDMLMHVADSMRFKVNTFTHILEGYKMAEKMRRHGVNASTFSDWWAYKFEVYDAIPFNAALLHSAGVNTGINSDDAEMGRRLNQEAAKTVKYGGVSEEEAWKMVTLDPARMLKLDHRMGSVLPGMDADLVLWSEHPLSIRATVLRTYVDGACYFDADQEHGLHADASEERDRLVRAMILARKNGEPTMKATKEEEHLWHCDDLGDGTAEDAQ